MPMAQPQAIAPPVPNPFPSAPAGAPAPQGGTVPMPQRPPQHMGPGMGPAMARGVGPGHHGGVAMNGRAAPVAPPSPLDYDERPRKSSSGPIIAILVAFIVILIAGFGFYVIAYRPDATTVAAADSAGASGQAQAEGAETPAATALGAITLTTTPPDPKVLVDGEPAPGVTSPFVISGLKPGVHKVTLEKDGFLTLEHDVTVGPNALQLAYNLEHKNVTLTVQSNPAGASLNLLVNGAATPLGKAPVSHELERKPGTQYTVEAVLTGHAAQSQAINFTGSKVQRIDFAMVPVIAQNSDPPPVQAPPIQEEAQTPPPKKSPGTTRRPKPRKPKPRKPTPTSNTPSAPSPPKTAAKTATLRIGTNPGVPPAEVYVDDRFVGKTPRPSVKVTPGRHTVKFKWPGGKVIKKSVTVASGGSSIVKAG